MPVRSAGCLTCRKRKVRCDGRRPGCERCARHGVHCSGYARERGALDFKDENNYAANRVSLRDLQNTTYQGTEDAFGNAMLTFDVKIVASNARQSWSMACDVSPAIGRGESELPPSLISVTANREQLYETFIDIFNPKDIDCGSQNFDFMRMLAILAPSHQVLRDGLDALSLMQVGSAHADQRLLGESISRHCKALRSTRNALSSGTFNEEAMLANISVLMICELFDATQGNPSAWLGHSRAFDRILLARGPDSLQSKLVMLVFYQSRYQALTRSLLRRKADSLSSPEWRAVLARMPLGVAGECMDFALQVPELLERYDALDAEVANALPEARKLLSDCERLHGRFQQWLINLQGSTSGPNGLPYTVLEVEKFPTYAALISNRTLTSGFHFHKQKLTFLYLQYWCSMYFLRSTMAHLGDYIRCRCGDQDGAVERLDESLSTGGDVELDSLVFSFCRCIPALAEPSAGAHGHTAMFLPLRIAGMHFEARCLESWTSWVDDMRANIFYNGIRPPNVREGDYPIARPLMSSNGSSALKCQMLRGGYAMEHHRHTG